MRFKPYLRLDELAYSVPNDYRIVTRYGAFVGAGCPFGNGRFVENATAMSAILFSLAF